MHKGARTDLCGGRGVTRVPTATRTGIRLTANSAQANRQSHSWRESISYFGAPIGHFDALSCYVGASVEFTSLCTTVGEVPVPHDIPTLAHVGGTCLLDSSLRYTARKIASERTVLPNLHGKKPESDESLS